MLTHNAQAVLSGDRPNLEQGGMRGLLRVIGAEHPHLKASYVDVDEQTGAESVARQLLAASGEDETAWRNDQWYTARLCRLAAPRVSGKPPSSTTPRPACAYRSVLR